jgi:leader peptidase (prepilin peptidase) / N-methyltransferase
MAGRGAVFGREVFLSVAGVALLGLIVGSFVNVVIHRVPLRRSVVRPASRCPVCDKEIRARDNVPLLSYVLLRGRCRSCGVPISPRYPVVEALTCVLFAAAAFTFGVGYELLHALVLIPVLLALAAIDLEHLLLPNAIVGPAALVGLALAALADPSGWWIYPLSALILAGSLLVLAISYPQGMGMGDVKMAGMLGSFLGPYGAMAIFLGALLGAITSGALMVSGKARRNTALPFGAFMALGALMALFAGPELWSLYLHSVRAA